MSEAESDREELEGEEPTVLPEREAMTILTQASKAEERDEQTERDDS